MEIGRTKRFLKSYQKLPQKIQIKVENTLIDFSRDQYQVMLHNHALIGIYTGLRSINVTGDYRIVFRELSDNRYELIELIDVGTHSKLYG